MLLRVSLPVPLVRRAQFFAIRVRESEVVDGVIARFRGACDDPERLYAYRVKEAPGELDEATGRSLTPALMQIVFERQFQFDFGGLI